MNEEVVMLKSVWVWEDMGVIRNLCRFWSFIKKKDNKFKAQKIIENFKVLRNLCKFLNLKEL